MRGPALLMLASCVVLAACSGPTEASPSAQPVAPSLTAWPDPPAVAAGALEADVAQAAGRLVGDAPNAAPDASALATIADSDDPRLAWLLSDLLRLAVTPDAEAALVDAFRRLTDTDPRDPRFGANAWLAMTNLLIGWDLPAPPGYRDHKAALLLRL